jgi:plastocyanin
MAVITAAMALTACSTGEPGTVAMVEGLRFEPNTITIEPGETVRFANDSSEVHTVTAEQQSLPQGGQYFASGNFESEAAAREAIERGFIGPEEDYSVTLEQPGAYAYICIPHESSGMRGTIVVER